MANARQFMATRTACWQTKGAVDAYPYLTANSIAAWDAEWNMGYNIQHTSTATRWKDLVGTRDFNLYGGYTWNADSLHFNGSNARGDLTVADSEIFMDNNFILECVFSQDVGVNVWGFVFGIVGVIMDMARASDCGVMLMI